MFVVHAIGWFLSGVLLINVLPHLIRGISGDKFPSPFAKPHGKKLSDVDAWWAHVQDKQIPQKYGVQAEPPEDRDWKMRDFTLADPSGVLWRIAQPSE
jgi:hypothetical protein